MTFKRLELAGWRQFDQVQLDIHPQLTVITGANGAGKSTILRLFSNQFGENYNFLATPKRKKSGGYEYGASIFRGLLERFGWARQSKNVVGSLEFSNGQTTTYAIPDNVNASYSLSILQNGNHPDPSTRVSGIHFDSHRPVPNYATVANIPTTVLSPESAFNQYMQSVRLLRLGQNNHRQQGPMYRMKEALISMAVFGEGNTSVERNNEAFNAFQGFQNALKATLPESLGFKKLDVRTPDIVVITETGEFLIDAASGGIHTLIDLTWRIFTYSLWNSKFVVTFDEPENHLHPSLQRSLMRNLLGAFPQAQFIIATHSPFMVSSVKDSNVYVLRYRDAQGNVSNVETFDSQPERRISSEKLDTVNKAGTAGEILRDVLGVETTMPEWVSEDIARIVDKYRGNEISDRTLIEIRGELERLGMEEFYPQSLSQLAGST